MLKGVTTGPTSLYYSDMLQIFDSNNITVSGNIVPSQNVLYSLGSITERWVDLFVGPGTINIAGPIGSVAVATIGSNLDSILYSEFGFATPFINVGPAVDPGTTAGIAGGWHIATVLGETGVTADLTAQLTNADGELHRPERKMRQNAVMICIFYNYVSSNLINVPL